MYVHRHFEFASFCVYTVRMYLPLSWCTRYEVVAAHAYAMHTPTFRRAIRPDPLINWQLLLFAPCGKTVPREIIVFARRTSMDKMHHRLHTTVY